MLPSTRSVALACGLTSSVSKTIPRRPDGVSHQLVILHSSRLTAGSGRADGIYGEPSVSMQITRPVSAPSTKSPVVVGQRISSWFSS